MPQRRGGGGGGASGGANSESVLRQGLRDLLARVERAAEEGGGANNGNGNRARNERARSGSRGRGAHERESRRGTAPSGTGNATGTSRASQPGDWTCRGCHFGPNFARRRDCYRCGRQRSPRGQGHASAAGGGPGSLSRGPVGAGGLRPLLGGRGEARGGVATSAKEFDRAPTFRVPGASVAARAAGAGSSNGTWAEVATARAPGGTAAPPRGGANATRTAQPNGPMGGGEEDDDGFQVVAGRKGRRADPGATEGGAGAQAHGPPERPAEQDALDQDGGGGARDGTLGDDDAADGQPTAADLRQQWQDEVALVKRLRGQGLPDDHPVMRAACDARDAAEQAWRGSREPAPVSIRLGRAQQKLDRAVALQADARRAMLEQEAAHRERMSTLQSAMDECTERVRLRRQQLGAIQNELGAGGTQDAGRQQAQRDAIREVHDTICGQVGPAIASLVEQLDSSAPAWTTLNGLLGTLAASKATLERAAERQDDRPAQFDIGDEAGDGGGGAGDEDDGWSESHELPGRQWYAEGTGGEWQGWNGAQQGAEESDQPMETEDWWGQPAHRWGSATRWRANGHGQWARASWADQLEAEMDGEGDGDGQPPAARRRLDAAGGDQATKDAQGQGHQQQPPHQQQQPQEDPEEARRRHQARINRIVAMAVESGVTPLTKGGEELVMLDPTQLEAWVAECLPAALLV